MSIGKRAFLYLIRNKKRSLLLCFILAVLMTISIIGFSLFKVSRESSEELYRKMGGYLTIQTSSLQETGKKTDTDEELLRNLLALDGIQNYNGVDTYYLYTQELALVPGRFAGSGLADERIPRFIGCIDSSLHEKFVTAEFVLTAGRHINVADKNKALISEELAVKNGLAVGDMIDATVEAGIRGYSKNSIGTSVNYEVAGIYAIRFNSPVMPETAECDLTDNYIFTDITAAMYLYDTKYPEEEDNSFVYGSGIMLFVEEPQYMDTFIEDLQQQNFANWDSFVVSVNNEVYQKNAESLAELVSISSAMLWVVMIFSVVILTLILVMWSRERVIEFGILLSLGIKKKSIVVQMLLETYIIAAASLLAAMVISSILMILFNEILADQSMKLFLRLDLLRISVVSFGAAVVIFLAVLFASKPIFTKKPRQILSELS